MKRRLRRAAPWAAAAAIVIAALPLAIHGGCSSVRFNQFMIQAVHARHATLPLRDAGRALRSAWLSGVNIAWNRPDSTPPAYEDGRAMFSHVFSWTPAYSVVYPTEGFYYFKTSDAAGEIWGNLRVAELDAGRLTMAYFRPRVDGTTRILGIGAEEGLAVVRHDDHCYDVTWDGRTVRFQVWEGESAPPVLPSMLPEEEFMGRVLDESGIAFLLLFNRETKSFYYVLDEASGVADAFDDLGDGLWHGRRTQFVYHRDSSTGRRLLVGVSLDAVRDNTFFDGPADQVPYRARLREALAAAYPSTLAGDGVDEHGVFLKREEWMRYAISPFHRYRSIQDLRSHLAHAPEGGTPGERWSRLTREWWNTPAYRERVAVQLESEGKHQAARAARSLPR